MKSHDDHSYETCTRAFGALVRAHDAVRHRVTRDLDESFGLSINEFDTLTALDSAPEQALRLTDLMEVVSLTQPAISRMVDRLANRGLIARKGGALDRRSVLVRLTPEGAAILRRAIPVHNLGIREMLLDRLTWDERETFKAILLKISGQDQVAVKNEKAS